MEMEELYRLFTANPSVQTDTRKLKKGDLYFALKGPNFNGNAFAKNAVEAGAEYAIIDEAQYAIHGKTILVKDVLETLQQLALHHRQQFTIPFIAITGSNGKTTTKELIHAVLSTTFKTSTTEGNLNNHIGVPLTLLKIKKETEMAVIEMGANHLGEIASYCTYTLPTHGLITNVGKAHLEGFGGEAGVRKGKGELFDFLRRNKGTIFQMTDYDYLREMSEGIEKVSTYGTQDADISGTVVQSDPLLEVAFTCGFTGGIKTSLVGSYNLPNVLAAVAVGKFFGVEEEKIRAAIENYTPSNSRSQLLAKGSNRLILDAYNANPSSMKAAIENFAKAEGNKILVLGAMAELGAESLDEHTAIVQQIAGYHWKNVLLVGGDFLKIPHSFLRFSTTEEAGEWLQKNTVEKHLPVNQRIKKHADGKSAELPVMMKEERPHRGYLNTVVSCRCPRCREGKLFKHPLSFRIKKTMEMYAACPACSQPTDIEVGFYYGTGYISYLVALGITGFSLLLWFLTIGFSFKDDRFLVWIILNSVFLLALQTWLMRFSRVLWLSFFVAYDPLWESTLPEAPERINDDQKNNW